MVIKVKTFWDISDEELNEWISKNVLKLIDIKFFTNKELVNSRKPPQMVVKTKVIYQSVKTGR